MTLTFRPTYSGGWETRHQFTRPAVYLDHWAIRLFSDNAALQARLIAALNASGGSLCLSYVSIVEFSAGGDPKHAEIAEAFFDAAMPHLYFMEIDIELAAQAEIAFGLGQSRPPGDKRTLQILTDRIHVMGNKLSIRGLIQAAAQSELGERFAEMKCELAKTVKREKENPMFKGKAKNYDPEPEIPAVFVMMGELLRPLVLDESATFEENDAADLQHALIASVYCDYVLLDRKWEHFLERAKTRIAESQRPFKTAECYSRRANGVERFLTALEAHATAGGTWR